jgi:hypothetical protein
VRTGGGAKAIGQRFVSRIGSSQGNKVTERARTLRISRPGPYTGPGMNPTRYGNEIALNVGKGSPGAGRTLYGQSGLQGTYGSVNPGNPRPRGELFPGWPSKK